jgi:hypothetical protein
MQTISRLVNIYFHSHLKHPGAVAANLRRIDSTFANEDANIR